MNFVNNKLIGDLNQIRGKKCNVKPLRKFPIVQSKYFFNNRNHPILPLVTKQNRIDKYEFKRPVPLRDTRNARNASHINLPSAFFGSAPLVGTPFLLQSAHHNSALQRTCSEFNPEIMSTPVEVVQQNKKIGPEKVLKTFCDTTRSEVASALATLFNEAKPVLHGIAQRLNKPQQMEDHNHRKGLPKPVDFSQLENNLKCKKRLPKPENFSLLEKNFEDEFQRTNFVQPKPSKLVSYKSNLKMDGIAQQNSSCQMDCSLFESYFENDFKKGVFVQRPPSSSMNSPSMEVDSHWEENQSIPNRKTRDCDMKPNNAKQESTFFKTPFWRNIDQKSHPIRNSNPDSSFLETPFWLSSGFDNRQSHPDISKIIRDNNQKLKNQPPSPMSSKLQEEIFPSNPYANENVILKNSDIERWCRMTRNFANRKSLEDLGTNRFEKQAPRNLREMLGQTYADTTLPSNSVVNCDLLGSDLNSDQFMDWADIFDPKQNVVKSSQKQSNRTNLLGKIPFDLEFPDSPTIPKSFSPISRFPPKRKTIDNMRINKNRPKNRFKRIFLNSDLSPPLPAAVVFNLASPISTFSCKRIFNETGNETTLNPFSELKPLKLKRFDETSPFEIFNDRNDTKPGNWNWKESKKLLRDRRLAGIKFDDTVLDVKWKPSIRPKQPRKSCSIDDTFGVYDNPRMLGQTKTILNSMEIDLIQSPYFRCNPRNYF